MNKLLWGSGLWCLQATLAFAQNERVVVMTSYPQELISRYEAAFETAHPEIDMVLDWRRSDDARQVLESGAAAVDVYWAPSLDTFVALAEQGRFEQQPLPYAELPGRIGALAIDDPQRRFAAFEVAGFGLAYSQAWLDAHNLPVPTDWTDLADARYAGAIVMPVPSQHGFSPMIYESILQGYGWDKGWSTIGEIAANAELMGGNGGSFIDDLAAGMKGIALSIDFFPKSAQANGQAVGFSYAATTLLSPAYVALTTAAPNPEAAKTFINFVLSDAGQTLLLHRDVSRLPVRPSAYGADAAFNPFADGVNVPAFDFTRAGAHQMLLAALFDAQITHRHAEFSALLNEIRNAQQRAGLDSATSAKLAAARAALTAPAITAAEAERLLSELHDGDIASGDLMQGEWKQRLDGRMAEARSVLAALP